MPSLDPARPEPERPSPLHGSDRPLAAIGFVVAAGILFSLSDAASKQLALTLPAVEIAWLRWIAFLIVVLPVLASTRGRVLRARAPALQVLRSACLVGSSVLFIAGLAHLPLAGATTINFVSPLVVTALSIPFLGERVGARRWAAILLGLVGVAIVVRPGSGAVGAAALFPLLSATCWASAMIATRRLAGIDGPWTAMSYSALIGLALLSLAVVPVFVLPTLGELGIAACLGFASTAAQYLIVLGFQRAPASVLAPFSYVQLVWTSALGFALFGNVPDSWTWTGAAIIIASGLYTAHRERVRSREAARA